MWLFDFAALFWLLSPRTSRTSASVANVFSQFFSLRISVLNLFMFDFRKI